MGICGLYLGPWQLWLGNFGVLPGDGIIIPVVEHCLRAEIAEIAEARGTLTFIYQTMVVLELARPSSLSIRGCPRSRSFPSMNLNVVSSKIPAPSTLPIFYLLWPLSCLNRILTGQFQLCWALIIRGYDRVTN